MKAVGLVVIGVAISLFGARPAATAEEPTITLGNVLLRLGMPRAVVEKELGHYYRLDNKAHEASVVVFSDKTAIGNVVFARGQLKTVLKYWDPPEDKQTGVDFAERFYAMVSGFIRDGHNRCLLEAGSSEDPPIPQCTVTIRCGRRSIEFLAARSSAHGDWANLLERIE
jgi:hypothetical protein